MIEFGSSSSVMSPQPRSARQSNNIIPIETLDNLEDNGLIYIDEETAENDEIIPLKSPIKRKFQKKKNFFNSFRSKSCSSSHGKKTKDPQIQDPNNLVSFFEDFNDSDRNLPPIQHFSSHKKKYGKRF